MRVACIQMRSTTGVDKNLQELESRVAQAADQGASYIQTPEMTSIIQLKPKFLFDEIEHDDGSVDQNSTIRFAASLAKKHNVWLHLGSIAVKSGENKAANRAVLISPEGQRITHYDKLHMFDVDLPNNESWRESAVYDAGNQAVLAKLPEFTLGFSICYDLRFPHLYRDLALNGAQVLACPAAFTRQTGEAHWHSLLRARAIENGAFVIAAAQGGKHEDGRETYGHSLIINPWGVIIAELDHNQPDILVCDIDIDEVEQARARIPNLSNSRHFEITKNNQE